MRTFRGAIAIATILAVAFGPSTLWAQDGFDDFAPSTPAPAPSPSLPPPLPAPSLPAPLPPPSLLPAPLPPPTPIAPAPSAPTPAPAPSAPAPAPTPRSAPDDGFDDGFAPTPTAPTADLPPPSTPPAEAPESVEATTTSAPIAEAAPAAPTDERAARRERAAMRRANSFYGPVGGIHVVDAGSGPVGTFRLSLMTDFMFLEDFLETNDYAKRFDGAIGLSWTAHRMIEVFAAYQSTAAWNTLGDPELIQSLGDVQLGVKLFHAVRPWFVLGGDVSLRIANPVGNVGVAFRGTSFGFRGNLAFDLRELPSRSIPLVARFNAQYWFDNSRNLVRDVEDARYDGLMMPRPRSQEPRNLVTDIERFALGINRTDFVNLRIGLEAPIETSPRFQIDPMLEWTWAIPVNRTGFVCPFVAGDLDGCLDRAGAKAFPMALTVGARVHPIVRGLSLTAAVDVGLTGARSFVRELAPTMPYAVVFGASYAYDPGMRRPDAEVTERVVESEPVYPVRGHVRGTIVEAGTETAVAGAIVRFEGRDANPIVADASGVFRSYSFEPGEVAMAIEHPDYEPGRCTATIPAELPAESAAVSEVPAAPETTPPTADVAFAAPAETTAAPAATSPAEPRVAHTPEEAEVEVAVRCELTARPRNGAATLRVAGDAGPITTPVTIALSGAATRSVTTGADGSIRVDDLPAGHYSARIEQAGFFLREQEFDVAPRGDDAVAITLIARPTRSLVRLAGRRIQISRQVNFVTDGAEILPASEGLLFEVADLLNTHPEITQVEIEGHTDDRGGAERNLDLSQRRADAVRTWLIDHGVTAARLTARGYGQTRSLVPNITASNRARNRRVAFTIRETAAAGD